MDRNDQHTVAYGTVADGEVFWRAFPRNEPGGAKLEIMARSRKLPDAVRAHAVEVLQSLSSEPISNETALRIRFQALKSPAKRETVKALLEHLLQVAYTT
jgi:hypothetical protein